MLEKARRLITGVAIAVAMPHEGQAQQTRASIAPYVGLSPSSDGALLLGLDFQTREFGRVAVSFTGSKWWFVGVGADAIVGAPSDEQGWALDAGATVRLSPAGRRWRVYGSARLGGLFYNDIDRGVWNPSVGLGAARTGPGSIGFYAELRYHALMANRPLDLPYRPDTNDYLVAQAGFRIRL